MTEERRVVGHDVEVRVADPETQTPTQLRGHAAVFGEETEIAGMFREVIEPGAFDDALTDDVRALLNHDPNKVLGRTKSGTLRLSVDGRGLAYEVDLPDTTYARDLAESVRRGDVSQSSFGFRVIEDSWERPASARDLPLRKVRKVELFDVSPVTYPAYASTSVSTRAREEAQHTRGVSPDDMAAEWERMRFGSF